MFLGPANSLNIFLIPPTYDIVRKDNMAAKISAVLSITVIRFIVILEIVLVYIPMFSKLLNMNTLEQLLLRLDSYLSHCSIQGKRSSSLKYNTKL